MNSKELNTIIKCAYKLLGALIIWAGIWCARVVGVGEIAFWVGLMGLGVMLYKPEPVQVHKRRPRRYHVGGEV